MNKKHIIKIQYSEDFPTLIKNASIPTLLNQTETQFLIPENKTKPVNEFDFTQYLDFLRKRYPGNTKISICCTFI